MNSVSVPKLFELTILKVVIVGVIISTSLMLVPGTSDSGGSLFNPFNYIIVIIVGAYGFGSNIIQLLHDGQKLTKFTFVFSLFMGG